MPADPFEALHLDPAPLAPRPAFTAALRARLQAALGPGPTPATTTSEEAAMSATDTAAGTTDTTATPARQAVTPYLCVHDATAALAWYAEVFGAVETLRYTSDDGRIGHAEFAIGTAKFMLSDPYPEIGVRSPRDLGGTSFSIHLGVTDVDYSYARAVHEGADGQRPPADQEYGARAATLVDPFGHRWMLDQPISGERAAEVDLEPEWTVRGRLPVEVGYLTMPTADAGRAAAFYRELFAWDVDPEGGHIGNTKLPMGLSPREGASGHATLYFRVDDVEPYAAQAVALGGRVVERNSYPSGDVVLCEDDQGVPFHLWRPGPGY
jgi:uncharacterized glyoxalase superfamily protein PhnB